MSATPLVESLRETLRGARNADRGWGYFPGKATRLEPTCWALAALGEQAETRELFARWPAEEGLLRDSEAAPANLAFNGLALALLLAQPQEPAAPVAEELAGGLVRAKGRRLPPSTVNRQDNSLQGWPWIAEEFSWVEPTAWCMLALKRWLGRRPDSVAADRVAEAERLLADRMCRDGGWNYGNANMLGQELRPYVPTTAVALVALQDCRKPFVRRGLDYLIAHATAERSAMALGLVRLALHVCGAEPPGLEPALEDCATAARPLGAVMPLAIALYALTIEEHDAAALRLA